MSTGRKTRHHDGQYENQSPLGGPLTRHDIVLAVIPLAFLLVAVMVGIFGVSLHPAVVAGSVLSGAALVDGLFLNPPVEP